MNKFYLIFISIALFIAACGGAKNEAEQTETTAQEEVKSEPEEKVAEAAVPRGQGIYKTYCQVCHQADGNGVPGMNPPLTQTEWVLGEKERLIKVVLNGLNGEIEIKGEIYNNVMASHSFLTDKQIADVLTYVRSSWGNDASEISEEEVAAVRASNEG